jgi:2-haloacid dehalogenase
MSAVPKLMTLHRRDFLTRVPLSALGFQNSASWGAGRRARIKAIAFDAFPVFDPRPVFALVSELYPNKGVELSHLWRTRQFEYTWLRTLSGRYSDFWQVTSDALVYAATALKLELPPDKHDRLMAAYLQLRCWPDVPELLSSLRNAGLRLAFLSNMTAKMLESGIRNSGLGTAFDHVLTTDRVKAYKPDPRAYRMALDTFGLKRDQILFVPFAAWDAAGAVSFGYPTFWVNRQHQPAEELGVTSDGTGENLLDLVRFIGCRR